MEYKYEIKIPKDRIAVLIGTKGQIKNQIEKETNTDIDIDSREGEITLIGNDALGLFTAREIITAIGRGFNPEIARLLLKQDFVFDVISMKDLIKTKDSYIRQKGRIIGKEGKTRRVIETLTGTYLSVYGKTVAIIGEAEDVAATRKAIESLLGGAKHGNVYKSLEKRKKVRFEDGTTYST